MRTKPKYSLEIYAAEITRRRLEMALSKEDLAAKCGVSASRLAKIEAGLAGGVSTSTVQGLCRVFGCEPQDISQVLEREAS